MADAQVFGSPGVLSNTIPSSDFEDDQDPRVISDGAGTWVAVWSSEDSLGGTIGLDSDILISRSVDDGATWSPVQATSPTVRSPIPSRT